MINIPKNSRPKLPDFYGSVTVGKRGQVAIPAEARRSFKIDTGAKLLVFSGRHKGALVLVKAESVTELIANTTAMISHFEGILKSIPAEVSGKGNGAGTDTE